MGEMFGVWVWVSLQVGVIHVQELGEKFHGRLGTDIQGLDNG